MAPKGKKPKSPKAASKAAPAPKKRAGKAPKSAPPKATNSAKEAPKATAAYADLRPSPAPVLGNIPWGYGDVRIVGMARDPHWACVYWEISDESIQAAQLKLKDPHAGLSLRVYDTTHREFNGLNAHSHWDLGIDRGTTVYHFKVGRPGATIHVDVGVRTWSGDFKPIARSNAIEMPRDSMSPDTRVEASTVFRSGPAFTYRHRYTPPPPSAAPPAPPPFEAQYPAESEPVFQALAGEGWSRSEWAETLMDGRVVRWIRWSGPVAAEHLPLLPKAGTIFRTIEVLFQGERRVLKMDSGEKIVYGPWRVTLEAVGPRGERKTVEQWMVRRRWTTHEGMIRVETPAVLRRVFGGSRVGVARSGSESRLDHEQGASELLQLGGSEWRWIGASENMALGSSEFLQAGGSEQLYLGSSETFMLGASESRGGSSEERP
ncbi:MAG: DUF4912 domain-containing protein [Planctomycetes bacterium]|nr:DUF4912 domain-containing protein [Planctomycetota bacterium]